MKILYVTAMNETINAFLIPHINMLVEQGNEVHCACNINREIDKRLEKRNVVYNSIDFSRNPLKIKYKQVVNQIRKLYKCNQYDIVHVHTPIAAFLIRFSLRKEKVKIIYTAHGFHFFKGAPILNWIVYYPLERIAAKWTDRLVTINNEDFSRAKKFKLRNNGQVKLMHGVGINSGEYIIENFDRDGYRKILDINSNDFMMLILADLNKNKNHIQVIQAIKDLQGMNIKVVCAGEGPLKEELIKNVNKNELSNKIKFLGFRKDVKELINASDCVGLFSMREGLPKSLMEGLCCGKPLIASKIRGCRDLIENSDIGELVNPNDYNTIVEALKIVSNKTYDSNKIIQSIEKYNLDRVLNEVYHIHQEVI